MTGISNGGYLTRWQLENRPALYDGSVDWEGMDGFVAAFPNRLRPILPCYREAFIALEESVERPRRHRRPGRSRGQQGTW